MSHAGSFAVSDSDRPEPIQDSMPVTGAASAAAAETTPPGRSSVSASLASRRSPWIAALLAGFPGLGSIYNGSYARGVAFFLSVLGLMFLAERSGEVWGFAVAFAWCFNIIDAYREARLIRAGLVDDLGVTRRRPATSAAEGLGLGVGLFVIGLIALLDSLGVDVDWIFGLWPVAMMLVGAWFIVAAVRRTRAG